MKSNGRQLLKTLLISTLILVAIWTSGCVRQRTIFVNPGDVIRVGPGGMTGKAYVKTGQGWELMPAVTVPEGHYVVPPPAK